MRSLKLRARNRFLIVALGVTGAALLVAIGAASLYFTRGLADPFPPPRDPLLPDLVLPAIDDLLVGVDRSTGQKTLMFTATIGNAGDGPLIIRADRRHRFSSDWRVDQRFLEADGSLSETETPADLVWGGHGHDHWHVRLGVSYLLETRFGDKSIVQNIRKAGYCFFDHVQSDVDPAARTTAHYRKHTCDGYDETSVEMGLTPGWEDPYYNFLPDQEFDVTNLPDGTYRLKAIADPDRLLRESNEMNNETWLDIELTTTASNPRVRVLRTGPSAGPRARIG